VLGCNVAFYFGSKLVPITIFGDAAFLKQHREGLEHYVEHGGIVVTNSNLVKKPTPPWLKVMKKHRQGLGIDGLGWNGNTGASAINLALLFGANPIYHLGYDMREGNFHNAYSSVTSSSSYARFLKGMDSVAKDLPRLFPGKRVINLEDGTSVLNVFPKESLKKHFEERIRS
jgi:hypothetical protein